MNLNKEEEIEEKKRKRCEYIAIKKYKTEAEADYFIRSSNPNSVWKTKYNHLTYCTMANCNNSENHKMRYKQYKCSCDKSCTLAYVVRSSVGECVTGQCKYFVWVTGEHINKEEEKIKKLFNLVFQYLFRKYLKNILKLIRLFLQKDYYTDYPNHVNSIVQSRRRIEIKNLFSLSI